MKIGVISDTHLIEADEGLCRVAAEVFKDISLILHAGDLTRIGVLEAFDGKRCIAVRGNMDRGTAAERLPQKRVVTVAGKRIGLIHGGGSPIGIEKRVMRAFSDVDIVVFGHTHKPFCRWIKGVLVFNPGAYCGTLLLKRKRSVGILSMADPISAEHIAIG
jgi:putative phosphoesterase